MLKRQTCILSVWRLAAQGQGWVGLLPSEGGEGESVPGRPPVRSRGRPSARVCVLTPPLKRPPVVRISADPKDLMFT